MIVTSTHTVESHAQRDGRSYVTEIHTDSTGKEHRFEYLAAPDTDYVAIRTARAAQLAEQLAEEEFNQIIS